MHLFPSSIDEGDYTYAREAACVDAAEAIAEALDHSGMSRADLARALKVSPGEVTVRLRGSRNLTVATLAETLHALGAQLEIKPAFAPKQLNSVSSADRDVSDRLVVWMVSNDDSPRSFHEEEHTASALFEAWPR